MRDPRSQYRFRGQVEPTAGIRASIFATEPVDGVATLRLYDPIDSWGGEWGVSAKEFVAAVDGLPRDTAEVRLHLNSPGGEVFEAITMLNALRNHPARVVAVVDGIAASAASFLAAGADETVMAQNSQLMIHDAWGISVGNAADMRATGEVLDKISDNIAAIYAEKAGTDAASWRQVMLTDAWYSAEEAVAAGLADRVEESVPQAQNTFDLSMFAHAGRDDAPAPLAPVRADDADWRAEKMRARLERSRPRT